MQETSSTLKNHDASIRNLETQMGQISKQLTERPKGTFPSDTIVNPREQCNAISLRSGKVVSPPSPPKISIFEKEGEPQMKSSAHDGKEDTSSGCIMMKGNSNTNQVTLRF